MSSGAAVTRTTDYWQKPVSWLPRPLLEPGQPLKTLAFGWALAFLPSIALAAAVALLLPDVPRPELNITGPVAVGLMVVFAPVVETLIMGAVLSVLLRFVPATVAVLLSAAGWGVLHSLSAAAWGLVIWWPFIIFSTIFVTWRKRSWLAGFGMAAATHALHNLVPALALLAAAKA